ncbi:DUF3153 domain-containing protein [Desmospora activa]|uniref:Uncharacterized protein DUF3153 n=1 Tax=Desmospora activa DSM 45169 TaxID=1121389 RepID=A0A2T4ZDN5_9BACL|nr:DUF3153 domain-containing protein [Desmospora activa]PTM59999.1 uncharacterized protein DUF3153 [Desmospora activa DSM 45169]
MPTTVVRWLKPMLLVLCLLLLSGCVDADMHVTINWDGSGTYQLKVLSNPLLAEQLTSYKESLERKGYEVESIEEGEQIGWVASRSVENVAEDPPGEDLLEELTPEGKTASSLPFPILGEENIGPLQVDSGLFITHIRFQREVDLTTLVGDDPLQQAFAKEMNLTLRLTLPLEPDEHNANEVSDDGKTLAWDLKPGEVQTVEVNWDIPNPYTLVLIVLLIGLLIGLLLIVLMVRWIRRRRRRRA